MTYNHKQWRNFLYLMILTYHLTTFSLPQVKKNVIAYCWHDVIAQYFWSFFSVFPAGTLCKITWLLGIKARNTLRFFQPNNEFVYRLCRHVRYFSANQTHTFTSLIWPHIKSCRFLDLLKRLIQAGGEFWTMLC